MHVALYKGKSFVSRVIRWLTRGPYSHACFVFDEKTEQAAIESLKRGIGFRKLDYIARDSVVEAWDTGVRNVRSLSSQHTPGTPVDIFDFDPVLTPADELALLRILDRQIGIPYAFRDVLRFVTRRKGGEHGRLFCSEQVTMDCRLIARPLFRNTQDWEVPPSWIQRSNGLKFNRSGTTS